MLAAERQLGYLNEGGRLVERHRRRGNVQFEPWRFLPLQAAGALPPWFSHAPCPAPRLPATHKTNNTRQSDDEMMMMDGEVGQKQTHTVYDA